MARRTNHANGLSDPRLLRLTEGGLEQVAVEQTDHYKVMREFCDDPAGFVEAPMADLGRRSAAC
jgi:hypothetical protein